MTTLNLEQIAQIIGREENINLNSGDTFSYTLVKKISEIVKSRLDSGITDVQAISESIFQGWVETAQSIVDNPAIIDNADNSIINTARGKRLLNSCKRIASTKYTHISESVKNRLDKQATSILTGSCDNTYIISSNIPKRMLHRVSILDELIKQKYFVTNL